MLTKLTLTIDDTVIKRAKKYAQIKNKSISRMVEEYLDIISDESNKELNFEQLSSPITDGMVGVVKDNGKDYKQLLEEALVERYV